MAQYDRQELRDRVIVNLQILEEGLEGGLSNADAVEAQAYQDTLREVRDLQSRFQGSTIRPNPVTQAPTVGLASAAQTADIKTLALENTVGALGLIAIVDISAFTSGDLAGVKLYRVDPTGDVLVATATFEVVAEGTGRRTVLFYPGGIDLGTALTFDGANAATFAMPRTFKLEAFDPDAYSMTFALDFLLIR